MLDSRTAGPPRCALIFPGQGAQRPAMGERWRDTAQWRIVDEVSGWTGRDIAELLLRTGESELRRADSAQLAIFTMSLLALDYLTEHRSIGPIHACAGHSLGEYTALVAAGALTPETGAKLVAARGAAMRTATLRWPGTMAAILGASSEVVEAFAAAARAGGARVWVANLNGPRQVVVSGTVEGVDAVTQDAKLARLKVVRIPVGGAFHTPLMRPAVPLLRRALAAAEFERTDVAVVANVDAGLYTAARWRALAERQLTAPVRWTAVLATLTRLGCTRLVEVGPSRILAKSIGRGDPAPTVRYFGYPGEFAP
ncbi:ACP S-malonyltransferase [Nocardia brasiliensis]|uniref:ACP S-malonyltransferase n=1 Tax=Nocardia brasiliensis TaxID=37326 RepID=UPI0024557421|nr:ACP S-malonyltransferase [Nocardia brasiliensis]